MSTTTTPLSNNHNNHPNNNSNSNNNQAPPSLTSEIDIFYHRTRPYPSDIKEKEKLCRYIHHCVAYLHHTCEQELNTSKKNRKKKFSPTKQIFLENMKLLRTSRSDWNVFTFGSLSWGTHIANESDIDMAVALNFKNGRGDKTFILKRLSQIISENDENGLLTVQILLHAKYPIIRIHHIYHKCIKVDISIADRHCLKRNQLMIEYMAYYQKCDIPIKKLIIFIKYWSKQRGINCAYYGYLNSFGFTLMIIQFIQAYIKKHKYKRYDTSLCCLVPAFFEFYAFKYDASKHAICIHSNSNEFGRKTDFNCFMQIIDPKNMENNVAKNVGYMQFNHIRAEFIRAVNIISLHKGKHSLFTLLTQDRFGNDAVSESPVGVHVDGASESNANSSPSCPSCESVSVSVSGSDPMATLESIANPIIS